MDKIVVPSVEVNPIPHRGVLKSSPMYNFQLAVADDINKLADSVNDLNSIITSAILAIKNDNQHLRRKVDALEKQIDYSEKVSGENGYFISRFVDFSDTKNISFPNGLNDQNSLMLNAEYGELTLPVKAIENKFYVISITSNKIVPPADLVYTVKSTFDKGEGDGLVNYERGGLISPGNPEYAFNGVNDKAWIRRVEFPIDSRVDQVEVELTVTVPEGSSSKANTIEINPFPNGSVDITELAIASDLGNNFTRLTGFEATDNFLARRYHFAATTVDQVKVRLRQRNWVEENGKKVFYYGLEELSVKLIDYDKTYARGASFGSNNSCTVRIEAPTGYHFSTVQRVDPSPNFLLEDMADRHIHLRLGINDDPSSGVIWTSDTDLPPQDSGRSITVVSNTLYAFIELNFVESSGGVLSPFNIGTTPYLHGIGLGFTLTKS